MNYTCAECGKHKLCGRMTVREDANGKSLVTRRICGDCWDAVYIRDGTATQVKDNQAGGGEHIIRSTKPYS